MSNKDAWLRLADDLYQSGTAIFDEARGAMEVKVAHDPRLLATVILARTLSNFRGVVVMIEHGLIVEARTLTRCCFENLIWIGGLDAGGDAFVQEAVQDEMRSRTQRADWLLKWGEAQTGKHDLVDQLKTFMAEVKKEHGKPKLISVKSAADKSRMKNSYIFYSALSGDAAHTSISALDRHVADREDGGLDLFSVAPVRDEEVVETLDFACQALLGVCVGVGDIAGRTPTSGSLPALALRYQSIQKNSVSVPGQ